jgi:hypothetical protein
VGDLAQPHSPTNIASGSLRGNPGWATVSTPSRYPCTTMGLFFFRLGSILDKIVPSQRAIPLISPSERLLAGCCADLMWNSLSMRLCGLELGASQSGCLSSGTIGWHAFVSPSGSIGSSCYLISLSLHDFCFPVLLTGSVTFAHGDQLLAFVSLQVKSSATTRGLRGKG